MKTRKVKRIYPMQIALMTLLGRTRRAPAEARKASRATAALVQCLKPPPMRF